MSIEKAALYEKFAAKTSDLVVMESDILWRDEFNQLVQSRTNCGRSSALG